MLDQGAGSKRGQAAVLTIVLAALAVAAVLAAEADAGCGGVARAGPDRNIGPGRAPLIIGDSPMLLALPNLAHEGYRANAHGCRQWREGMTVLRSYKHRNPLPRLVVIALGSNGTVNRANIKTALRIVGKHRRLGLWTPRELGGGSGSDAKIMRKLAKRHKKRIVLLDWVRYSRGHSGWFQADGLHLTSTGARHFGRLAHKPLHLLPHR